MGGLGSGLGGSHGFGGGSALREDRFASMTGRSAPLGNVKEDVHFKPPADAGFGGGNASSDPVHDQYAEMQRKIKAAQDKAAGIEPETFSSNSSKDVVKRLREKYGGF
ncbi:Uncharacterised protein [uncultured archaeon]|nr:Uncharacterised protein [uncultured archaeon]